MYDHTISEHTISIMTVFMVVYLYISLIRFEGQDNNNETKQKTYECRSKSQMWCKVINSVSSRSKSGKCLVDYLYKIGTFDGVLTNADQILGFLNDLRSKVVK